MAHPGGRPPIFKTVEEMSEKIEDYFNACAGAYLTDKDGGYILDRTGRPIMRGETPPTITGLALALGFSSRRTLTAYQGRAAFRDIVTRAKSRVEMYAEERLFDRDSVEGAKFSLRFNFRWGIEEKQGAQSYTSVQIKETSAGML